MNIIEIKESFIERFGSDPRIIEAPGRINLIGEHTDYNDGFVLPAAIDKEVIFAIGENNSRTIRLYAKDLDQYYETDIDDLKSSDLGWPDYLNGVVDQLFKRGHTINGFDCVFGSDIPIGAGLSSSAAIESGLAFALNEINDLNIDKFELVKLAQKAENEFVGVNCGIMDQFASVFGKAGHVFRLDCRSLEYEYFPLELKDIGILLIDTKVKHSLASSEYNTRRKECEAGVEMYAKYDPSVKSLRDVSLNLHQNLVNEMDPIVYKRCDYVIREIRRVEEACEDLKAGRIESFGQKMYETHHGLSNDYQVSCAELDFLVDQTIQDDLVLGARMMGGGFGGCTINLVRENHIPELMEKIAKAYSVQFGIKPLFYKVKVGDGVRETGIV